MLIAAACAVIVLGAAVTSAVIFGGEKPIVYPLEGMEIVNTSSDRDIYYSLAELEEASDLIVIGKFTDNAEQELEYSGVSLINATSTNTISVSKVLKGEAPDKITLSQRYGVLKEENKLVTFSGMTPMNMNEEWIFFLYYDEMNKTYWCSGDYTGRYPLPDKLGDDMIQDFKSIIAEREEWVKSKKKLTADEIESWYESGGMVYPAEDGTFYGIAAEESATLIGYETELQELRGKINSDDFGVYKNDSINLSLYNSIINKYSIS
jgi:hypothetical protein